MNFDVVNLGCKVNRVESDSIAAGLLSLGCEWAENGNADVVVVNTCTVTAEADKKARKAVRHALSANPQAKVLVSGCAVAIKPDDFSAIDSQRVRVVSRFDLEHNLAQLVGANDTSAQGTSLERGLRIGKGFNTRVTLKVQDGCDNACTYCIVHVARGKARSMPANAVVSEAVSYAQAGTREIVLGGINIGSYRSGQTDLCALLEQLLAETATLPDAQQPVRFRISSIEPEDVSDSLIALMAASNGRICRHFHLPLQSGSSKVLSQMNRRYTAEDFAALVSRLYEAMPQMSLSTDIIVGFPGETDADFQDTLRLAKECRFSKIHVFPYSMREGTPAASRNDQVPAEVKRARAQELRALSSELAAADLRRRAGSTEMLLVEPDFALTESYHEVVMPEAHTIGSLVPYTFNEKTVLHGNTR